MGNSNNKTSDSNKRNPLNGNESTSQVRIEENSQEAQKFLLTNLYNSRDDVQAETVTLACKDGHVHAHKCVLVAGSDYFRAIFNRSSLESKKNTILLHDTSMEVVDIVLKSIYAQDIPMHLEIPDSMLREIIITADKMQLKGLFDKFWNKYSDPITLDKFINVWQMAQMFNQDETVKTVQKFVLMNLKRISQTHMLSDMTVKQLESLIAKVKPDKLGEFVVFVINWEMKTRDRRENNNTEIVMDLLSKCGVENLPDHSLRKLLSSEIVVESGSVFNVLCKEATVRWLATAARKIRIFAFEVGLENSEFSASLLSDECWTPGLGRPDLLHGDTPIDCFPSISSTTHECYLKLFNLGEMLLSVTANCNEVFLQTTDGEYPCFNFELKTWRMVDFGDRIADCKRMLLAAGQTYFFDVDERRVKIVNKRLNSCTTKEKLPGNWQSVKCKTLCTNGTEKLIFFQKRPESCLLVYDVAYDFWRVVPSPNISGEVILYINYDEDCLIFEKTDVAYNIYSLETMTVVKEYARKGSCDNWIHFDASFKT